MTVYAPSDHHSITVPADDEHRGCGQPHVRDVGPDQAWALTCDAGCEQWLLAHDDRWVKDVMDIKPTFDETRALERFETRGVRDREALMALAMARMAGISSAEIPPSVSKLLTGLPAHVPGVMVCGNGHGNTPGSRFCRECGSPMSTPAPVAAITPGEPA